MHETGRFWTFGQAPSSNVANGSAEVPQRILIVET
jgi:hypothetical protein